MTSNPDAPPPRGSTLIRLEEHRARRAGSDRRYLEAVLADLPELVATWRRDVAAGRVTDTSAARQTYARAWGERRRRRLTATG